MQFMILATEAWRHVLSSLQTYRRVFRLSFENRKNLRGGSRTRVNRWNMKTCCQEYYVDLPITEDSIYVLMCFVVLYTFKVLSADAEQNATL